ncbi:MAG: ABC transporter permease [Bacteroidales bacterium]|nr:ABC transporter permease [Bacteroidales bacterium]
MTFERLIARRFLKREKKTFSRPLVNIATYTIALGIVVMIMAVMILRGFQNNITGKVAGFGSHITIRGFGWGNDFDEIPIVMSPEELQRIANVPGVEKVQPYAVKGGMLKTDEQIQGIIFKGIDSCYDKTFFSQNLVNGRLPEIGGESASKEVIISQRIANMLQIDTGMKAPTYFWTGDNYRARDFRVVGIYNTDLPEFDEHYIFGDIKQVQKLNKWENGEVAGYELTVDNYDKLDAIASEVQGVTRPDLEVTTIRENNLSMFAWLELLDSNIALILAIMAIVCVTSVVSALLIMIFERTAMIGVLKTLGSSNRSIRRIFMLKAMPIIIRGVVIGDAIALALALLQSRFHILKLDSNNYYMSFVPVDINAWYFIAISVATFAVCTLALLIPSTYIARIDPAKTIRVE